MAVGVEGHGDRILAPRLHRHAVVPDAVVLLIEDRFGPSDGDPGTPGKAIVLRGLKAEADPVGGRRLQGLPFSQRGLYLAIGVNGIPITGNNPEFGAV